MSNAFDSFCLHRDAVRLSMYMGMPSIGWGWPSSSRSVWIGYAHWLPRKMLATSASAADATTFFMVVHITWMGRCFWLLLSVYSWAQTSQRRVTLLRVVQDMLRQFLLRGSCHLPGTVVLLPDKLIGSRVSALFVVLLLTLVSLVLVRSHLMPALYRDQFRNNNWTYRKF